MEKLVTVIGGDGFVGRYIVDALLRAGARVRVASRNPRHGYFLKAQANLGQIAFASVDITKPETIASAIAGCDAVINLVGILNGKFDAVQRDGARNVAQASQAAGVACLIHMSAIGADPASESRYGRSKGEGEAAVNAAFPTATILRPSIIFGREDSFINRFAGLIRLFPAVPVIGGGTRFQPVFVGDIAQAVAAIVETPTLHQGKTYEFGGPHIYSMAELNKWIAVQIGVRKPMIAVPSFAAAAMARFTGWLPGAPITWDQWLMLQSDNIVRGEDGLATLGIAPTSLDSIAEGWLVVYRKHGRFGPRL